MAKRVSEFSQVGRLLQGDFPTCVQEGVKGAFFFVGSIPLSCYDRAKNRSMIYASEAEAVTAAVMAGCTRIQRCDCSFVDVALERQSLEEAAMLEQEQTSNYYRNVCGSLHNR